MIGFGPMLPEFGAPYRLTCACQDCAGTGTAGEGDAACECQACGGSGEVEVEAAEAAS